MKQLLLFTLGLLTSAASSPAFANGSNPAAVDYGRRPSYSGGGGYYGGSSYGGGGSYGGGFSEDDDAPPPRAYTSYSSRRSSSSSYTRPSRSSGWNCPGGMTGSNTSRGYAQSRRESQAIADAAGGRSTASTTDSSMDPIMLQVGAYVRAHAHAPPGLGNCLRPVRDALARFGLIKPGHYGDPPNYINLLQNRCFTNAISRYPTPNAAPDGAVLIYKGINPYGDRNARHGHIEVKFHGQYVSDYYSYNARTGPGGPRTGHNRMLIGVMIKRKSCN